MSDRAESGTCVLLLGAAQSTVHVSGFPVCTIGPVEKEFVPSCLTGFESENGVFSIILTPKKGKMGRFFKKVMILATAGVKLSGLICLVSLNNRKFHKMHDTDLVLFYRHFYYRTKFL